MCLILSLLRAAPEPRTIFNEGILLGGPGLFR